MGMRKEMSLLKHKFTETFTFSVLITSNWFSFERVTTIFFLLFDNRGMLHVEHVFSVRVTKVIHRWFKVQYHNCLSQLFMEDKILIVGRNFSRPKKFHRSMIF